MFKKILRGAGIAFLTVSLTVLIIAAAAVAGVGIWARHALTSDLDDTLYAAAMSDRTTRLYYYDAAGEAKELTGDRVNGWQNTLFCPLEEISPHLCHAFIAIEDKRFYRHGGVDWARTASAAVQLLRHGTADFGGSTITQQLVKNLTGENERSVTRKLTELMRAAEVERELSKEEILERYLNVVNLAQSCYGVRAAANLYFSAEPADLTPAQAAAIAAITNNPTRYDPIRHPEENLKRRDLILSEMHVQGYLDDATYNSAVATPLELQVNEQLLAGHINSWYADLVIADVTAALQKEKGMSAAEASRLISCGGLKIYTAVDPRLQEMLENYYLDASNFPTHKGGKKAQSAMMIVEPQSGAILAVVGAVGEKNSNRIQNFATDAQRPSGSVIKPLAVYGPALEANLITWATVIDDIPLTFRENGAPWPHNSPNLYRGLTTVREGVAQSVNTVSVSVFERLGAAASYRFLTQKLGFCSLDSEKDRTSIQLALGQQVTGVTLRELVGGYTALANGGVYEGTHSFWRVENTKGETILQGAPLEQRAMGEDSAAVLTMLLRQVTENGTGKAVTLKHTVDVAGKTGTSSNNCDKWFIGYTPELLAGVWYGFEYPASLADVGGNPALDTFDAVMHQATEIRGVTIRQFVTPESVVAARYCKDSGKCPCEICALDPRGERTEIGYFKAGTEPTETCDRHVLVNYCEGGGVAGEACPAELCHPVALLRVMRQFPCQIYVRDAAYTCADPNAIIQPNLIYNVPYYIQNAEERQYVGVGMDEIPYNHACPVHTGEGFWERRFLPPGA